MWGWGVNEDKTRVTTHTRRRRGALGLNDYGGGRSGARLMIILDIRVILGAPGDRTHDTGTSDVDDITNVVGTGPGDNGLLEHSEVSGEGGVIIGVHDFPDGNATEDAVEREVQDMDTFWGT
jgi:hypothetical protein